MKTTITVSKKFTIQPIKFNSISPSTSLTVNDVPIEKAEEIHKNLESIVDVLIHRQLENDAKIMASIKKFGLGEYFKNIDREKMQIELDNSIENIIEINKED